MAETVVESGSEQRKAEPKEPSYNWTDNQTTSLMQVLKEFHSKFGYSKTYDWAVINKAFKKKTGVDLTKHGKTIARDKVEHMKKLWSNWFDLRFKFDRAVWDKTTGMIILSDECWDSFKKSDNNKYLHFRTKGVDPDLCQMWDDVFGSTMVMEKNVTSVQPAIDLDDDRTDSLNQKQAIELDMLLDQDPLEDDLSLKDSLNDSFTTPLSTGKGCDPLKRKRKSYSTSLNGKDTLSIMEGEYDSTGRYVTPAKKQYEISDCFKVVEKMVEDNLIKDSSKLWCFTISKLGNPEVRNTFMTLRRNSARVAWLKYEYDTTYKLFVP